MKKPPPLQNETSPLAHLVAQNFAELIEERKQQIESAFLNYRMSFLSFAFSLTKNTSMAEDLVQDAFDQAIMDLDLWDETIHSNQELIGSMILEAYERTQINFESAIHCLCSIHEEKSTANPSASASPTDNISMMRRQFCEILGQDENLTDAERLSLLAQVLPAHKTGNILQSLGIGTEVLESACKKSAGNEDLRIILHEMTAAQ